MKLREDQKPAEEFIPENLELVDPVVKYERNPEEEFIGIRADEHHFTNNALRSAEISEELPSKPAIGMNVRAVEPKDVNFILSAWMKSYRCEHDRNYAVDPVYFPSQQRLISQLASKPGCVALLAVAVDDPDQILGFIVCEPATAVAYPDGSQRLRPLVVHYVYVKHLFRGFGVARKLMEYCGWEDGQEFLASHITHAFTKNNRAAMKKYKILYHPYVLMVQGWEKDFTVKDSSNG